MKKILVLLPLLAAGILLAQPAMQKAALGECKLESGQIIRNCTVAYRTFGTLNQARSNAVLFPTWFTGTSKELADSISPTGLVDSSRYFVIAVDAFGDGESSSPSNSKVQPRLKFPAFTIRDMVQAQHRLVTEVLHLPRLYAVLGISMGGMQAFEWAVSYPGFADRIVPIVGSPRLTSYDLMLWRAEEEAIVEDFGWRNGAYRARPAMRAVADIHNLALYTPAYRVRETNRKAYPEYIKQIEAQGTGNMDPTDWLYQLRAMMAHDVAGPNRSMADAARSVKAKMLIVIAAQDHMVNPTPAAEFAALRNSGPLVLNGDCGHMSTSCESATLIPAVRSFLTAP